MARNTYNTFFHIQTKTNDTFKNFVIIYIRTLKVTVLFWYGINYRSDTKVQKAGHELILCQNQ